jgi:hypothetical protein
MRETLKVLHCAQELRETYKQLTQEKIMQI